MKSLISILIVGLCEISGWGDPPQCDPLWSCVPCLERACIFSTLAEGGGVCYAAGKRPDGRFPYTWFPPDTVKCPGGHEDEEWEWEDWHTCAIVLFVWTTSAVVYLVMAKIRAWTCPPVHQEEVPSWPTGRGPPSHQEPPQRPPQPDWRANPRRSPRLEEQRLKNLRQGHEGPSTLTNPTNPFVLGNFHSIPLAYINPDSSAVEINPFGLISTQGDTSV